MCSAPNPELSGGVAIALEWFVINRGYYCGFNGK